MKRSHHARKTLLLSVVALVLSCAMLVGTTFAWFTDSVSTGNNIIQSGNLDLKVSYKPYGAGYTEWTAVTKDSVIFGQDALYEPGFTEAVWLKVENVGTLAFKYKFALTVFEEVPGINKNNEEFLLSDFLEVKYANVTDIAGWESFYATRQEALNGFAYGASANSGAVKFDDNMLFVEDSVVYAPTDPVMGQYDCAYVLLILNMPTTVGNEANHNGTNIPSISFKLSTVATQLIHEEDGFGNDYDLDAVYPVIERVIDRGATSGVECTVTNAGSLSIAPSATPVPDANSGKVYHSGQWREAVVYDSNGNPIMEGYNAPAGTSGDAGGYFCDRNSVTSLVIDEGITSIGSFAAQFPNLTGEVVIPASVTYIGQEAFRDTAITKLTFAEGGTEPLCIAPGAFKGLDVTQIVLPADRPEIHLHCWSFNDCTQLKSVFIPANTKFVGWTHVDYYGMDYVYGKYANSSDIFARCNALQTITFGDENVKNAFLAAQGNAGMVQKLGVTLKVQ